VRRLFEAAVELARAYYEMYAGVTADALRPVTLETAGITADAVTMSSHSPGPGGNTLLNVGFPVERFDRLAYYTLPYMFVHECLCHCFQRGSNDDYIFAEGWMDWLSYKVLEDVVSGNSAAASHLRSNFPSPGKLLSATVERRLRHEKQPSVRVGEAAARKVLELMENVTETRDKAWHAFLELSLKLNSLNIQDRRRDKFARASYSLSVPTKSGQSPFAMTEYIKAFLINREAIEFMDSVIHAAADPHGLSGS
jgi:hypothetical protein